VTARRSRTIAIIGAGPCGLEAALYARALGYRVTVYEREEVGASIRRWGFLRLFSPWKMNLSSLALDILERGGDPPDPEAFPTGREFVERVLEPLAHSLGEGIERGVEVAGIARLGLLKGDNVGGKLRVRAPFRLLLRRQGREEEALADVVIDATGVYGNPCSLGDGGLPALGESAARDAIRYHLPDLRAEREEWRGRTVLLAGAGYSAATTLAGLLALREEDPRTEIIWVRRSSGPDPFPVFNPDPLPERSRLGREGNRITAGPPAGVTAIAGVTVRAMTPLGARWRVEFRPVDGGDVPAPVVVDRLIAHVGYRPDPGLYRELQVHQCYASEGPMSLAARLLEKHGASGDCLAQGGLGPGVMKNPEPNFFIVGNKSYGRRSDFLIRAGLEGIRDVFRTIEEDPALDLHGSLRDGAGAPGR
jgi:hypothetical protein